MALQVAGMEVQQEKVITATVGSGILGRHMVADFGCTVELGKLDHNIAGWK
jgi:hypothetical protein